MYVHTVLKLSEYAYTHVTSTAEAEKVVNRLQETLNVEQGVPCDNIGSTDAEAGALAPMTAQVVMEVFYGARVAIPDLMRAIAQLSRYRIKWTNQYDER